MKVLIEVPEPQILYCVVNGHVFLEYLGIASIHNEVRDAESRGGVKVRLKFVEAGKNSPFVTPITTVAWRSGITRCPIGCWYIRDRCIFTIVTLVL